MKKLTVSIGITLDDSIVRRLNLCKEKGLSSNDLCGVCKLYEVYGDFAAPIYEAWLAKSEQEGGEA
jgi:hypothetical protein